MHTIITIAQFFLGIYKIGYFTKLWAKLGFSSHTHQELYDQNVTFIDIKLHAKYQDNM